MIDPAPVPVTRIGVVIPARNERQLLPLCLAALNRAAALVAQPVTVVVVLDSCTDGTDAVLSDEAWTGLHRVVGLPVDFHNVGRSRAAGCDWLLARYPSDSLWLATSDADSSVPDGWFSGQLRRADAGADAVIGTVRVADWTGHSDAARRSYLDAYRDAEDHRHMHGANLSMRARSYLAAGGFAPLAADEDVRLVDGLISAGQRISWAGDLAVLTSGRLVGRAPAGFAQHLQLIADDPAQVPAQKLPALPIAL